MRPRSLVAAALSVALSVASAACGDGINEGVRITKSDSTDTTDGDDPAPSATSPDDTTPDDSSPSNTSPSNTSPDAGGDATPTPDSDEAFGWDDFGDGLETGSLSVPIDYDDPSKGEFDLFVVRHPAADPSRRIGSLLVNPGGPGFGGAILAQIADQVYSDDLVDRFDIIGWDPRGTGLTTPAVDCIDEYDPYFAPSFEGLTDDEARQLSEDLAVEFAAACADNNRDILEHVGTNNSARDIDRIRDALGEDTITYFGFSYGSELGATWATLFPDTVRAAVLDGAADPNADALEGSLQQSRGFEQALNTFLARCSADPSCAFHNDGDAEGAFDALLDSLSADPVPSEAGRPDVDPGVAISGVIQAMYSEDLWPQLERALADAQDGDGGGLLELYDSYFQRRPDGTYDNSLEAFQVISCSDTEERLSVEEEDANAPLYEDAAPRLYGETKGGSYFCTFFPESDDPRVDITGADAGPILVVGTTGDPATPLESSENMAEALENGVLLVVDAEQHTGYDVNSCSMDTIDAYLIELAIPDEGTMC
ncbi:MAG: alpha/beta hydrolase [Ilumatobacteraceae bacterium]